jgi:hypothetical protein
VPLKPEIYRQLVRCAACDFSTKVRVNLIKHLKLHLVKSKLGKRGKIFYLATFCTILVLMDTVRYRTFFTVHIYVLPL